VLTELRDKAGHSGPRQPRQFYEVCLVEPAVLTQQIQDSPPVLDTATLEVFGCLHVSHEPGLPSLSNDTLSNGGDVLAERLC
jgi:hypothetical protein